MPRIKLEMPTVFQYSTSVEVLISHINYGGHLGNDALLSILQEARLRFLASLGYSELDVDGSGIVVADVAVQYLAEAFRGDRLLVRLALGDAGSRGFELFYEVTRERDKCLIAKAKTGIVFFDYSIRRSCPMPETFRRHFTSG